MSMIRRLMKLGANCFLCVACALLVACDYTVPLVRTPSVGIDGAVLGSWLREGEQGKGERLLVLPLGKQEFLVVYPAGADGAMYARGCLWRNKAMTLVQLDWFGTAKGTVPDDTRTFQYVSYVVERDTLKLSLLNPDVVSKDVKSAKELAKAISDSHANPKLFHNEMVFRKVKN